MREVLQQYGSSIITAFIAMAIMVILGGVTIFGVTGIVDVAGRGISDYADDDVLIGDTVTTASLDNQSMLAVPELTVKTNPVEEVGISLNDIFDVSNVSGDIDLTVAQITTVLNDSSTDAISQGMAGVNGKVITFNKAGDYYISVDIRQSDRKITRTYKITVDKKPVAASPSISWDFSGFSGFGDLQVTTIGGKQAISSSSHSVWVIPSYNKGSGWSYKTVSK